MTHKTKKSKNQIIIEALEDWLIWNSPDVYCESDIYYE